MKLLYINACVRSNSRTKGLDDYLIKKFEAEVKELRLIDLGLQPLTSEMLEKRSLLIAAQKFDDKEFVLAREFAEADIIVVAAPYWDMSFPAMLKLYIEHINVIPLVFKYSVTGEIVPMCKAKKLYYVTTKGGYGSDEYGFGYIAGLSKNLYGIMENVLIKAEGLDVQGNNSKEILDLTKGRIDHLDLECK